MNPVNVWEMDPNDAIDNQMDPERVFERLGRLKELAVQRCNGGHQLRKIQNVEVEFLEATKPRPVARRVVPIHGISCGTQLGVCEAAPPLTWPVQAPGLVNLPPDVLLELASHVYPRDLIHLSYTSKSLRHQLMSRKSRPTWTTVLKNTIGLPQCPSDMCEPLYAALVFGHHCFGCGVDDAFWVDYALRLRLCAQCYKANVVEANDVLHLLPEDDRDIIDDVVLMLVPSANVFNFSEHDTSFHRVIPVFHLRQDFFFKPELEAILNLLWPLPTPDDIMELTPLLRDRTTCVAERHAHAILLHAWDGVLRASPKHSEELRVYCEIMEELQDALEIPFPKSGLGEGISAFFDFVSSPPFGLYKPHTQLATEQLTLALREDAARATRIRARYTEMAEWYTDILDRHLGYGDYEHAGMPNAHDGARLWDNLVHEDDARARIDVDAVVGGSKLGSVIQALWGYPRDVVRCLTWALERHEWEHGGATQRGGEGRGNGMKCKGLYEGSEDAVLRPTALFRCAGCGDCPYGWPEINVHWRTVHPDESVWIDLGGGRQYKAWVWEAGINIAERIVAVLIGQGLSKRDRTKARLDKLIKEGRVFCTCGDPTMVTPGNGLNWAALVKHVFVHLEANTRRTVIPSKTADEDVMWINDHDLACCIKYLPPGADTSQAANRFQADPDTHGRIAQLLNQCPEKSRLVCCLCSALTPDDKKDFTLFLPKDADAMLYHMQAKHAKSFWEQDIAFLEESALKNAWPLG